jgi:hypothetical protein
MHSGVGFARSFPVGLRRMQLLSLGQLLGTVGVQQVSPGILEFLQRREILIAVGLLVVTQVVRILANWVASKVVAKPKEATFGNAVKFWLGSLALLIGLTVGIAFLIPIVSSLTQSWRQISAFSGVALLAVVILFAIPMKIYEIGFWRALGLILLAGIMEGIVTFGLTFAAQQFIYSEKDLVAFADINRTKLAQLTSKMDQLTGKDAAVEIDRLLNEAQAVPPRPLAEREATVRTLQRKLDDRRRTLPPGDPEAAATFRRQLGRYMQILNRVKAERAALS